MKILLVQDFLRSGGTERQTVRLARAFAAAGHETHLVTFRPGGPLRPSEPGENLTLVSLQKRDSRLDWWAPGLRRYAKTVSPEVVLCMGRMANSYGRALQVALPSTAVISTMRTGKPLPLPFRRSLGATAHVIANSAAAGDHLIDAYNVPGEKITVIPNGLVFAPQGAQTDEETRSSIRAKFGAKPDDVILVDVAMFRPEKNQLDLIDMVKTLDPDLPWRLWLAGEGPTVEKCRSHAAALGLADRVTLLGWHPDPRPIYRAADIAVHASKRESLSNFLIEAQAHGLPAVARAARGVSETFVDGKTGFLIEPDDLAGFAAAVTRLLTEPALRSKMAAAAIRQATTNFSTDAQVKAHLDLFEKLASLDRSA